MSKKRRNFAQVQMVKRGVLTMYGFKDKLCLPAEIELVKQNRPKMLEAYGRKLSTEAERVMIEEGHHKLLRAYHHKLDISNQILLIQTNKHKLISAYRFSFCPEAEKHLPAKNKVKKQCGNTTIA